MRFFLLPLSTMNCSGEPFTHICEWKRRSPSSGSSGSFFWILAVATVALGSASMICFPLPFPLSGSGSGLEHASDSKDFNSATNDCLVRHTCVMSGTLVEFTSLSCVLLRLHGVVIFLRL